MVDDLVDKPARECGFRVDHAAGQDHFHRLAFADDLSQTLGAAIPGNHPKAHLRQAHAGVGRGDAHVGRHGQFQAAAKGESVDGRHHRFAALLDPVEQVALTATRQLLALGLVEVGEFFDVRAGHEGLFARASQDDDANFWVVLGRFKGRAEGVDDVAVERIEGFRPMDRQGEDAILEGFQNKGHDVGLQIAECESKLRNAPPAFLPRTA